MIEPQPPIICVGCAPSTGSTLLADLLDSVPGVLCGPELSIFSIPDAYRWDDTFVDQAQRNLPFPVSYSLAGQSRFFNRRHLEAVGLTDERLAQILTSSASLPQFSASFASRFSRFRQRRGSVLAEKTPMNLHCALRFLDHFPNGRFIVLVRDGRSVVSSLRRRGYTLYESALCWLWESRVGEDVLAASERAAEVRYEDLVRRPFGVTADLVRPLIGEVPPGQIEHLYRNNKYRADLDRVDSWRVRSYHGTVTPGLAFDDLSHDEVALMESLALVRPDGSVVDFTDTLLRHGYEPSGAECTDLSVLESSTTEYLQRSTNRHLHHGYSLVMRGASIHQQLIDYEALRQTTPPLRTPDP